MKFKKKPVVIEAIQFDGTYESIRRICDWANSNPDPEEDPWVSYVTDSSHAVDDPLVHTLEGEMSIGIGDWVIKGVKGEFYPCKPDIFEMTYGRVEEE